MSNVPASAACCSVEVFRRSIPGWVNIKYWVSESEILGDEPDPNALDIISWDQTYYVHVIVELTDPVRRHFCGKLCVDVDIDTCGPAPDYEFKEQEQDIDPCNRTGQYYFCFPLEPPVFVPDPKHPARCGRVYRLCVTVGSHDPCGNPGLIWGHCDSLEIAVHPPIAVP